MKQELSLASPIEATEYISRALVTSRETEDLKITPVGMIVFAEKTKAVALGATYEGSLLTSYLELPQEVNWERIMGRTGRILNLDHLHDISIGQLDMAGVSIGTFPSIRGSSSVAIHINYTNVPDQEKKVHILDEEEMLAVLTGRAGGITIFDGAGLPEDNALLFEKEVAGQNLGWLFFFRPEDGNNWGADSVSGLWSFFKSLNQEFIENVPDPTQKEALSVLARDIRMGGLKFKSDVREELFRSQVIAHARMFERTEGREYLDFLKRNLVSFRLDLWELLVLSAGFELRKYLDFVELPDKSSTVEASVSRLILTDRLKHESLEEEEGLGIYKLLQTEKARRIRKAAEDDYGDNKPSMRTYLNELAFYVMEARTKEEFEDIETLLDEYREWNHGVNYWYCEIDFDDSKAKVKFSESWYSNSHKRTMLNEFEKQLQIQKERYFIAD